MLSCWSTGFEPTPCAAASNVSLALVIPGARVQQATSNAVTRCSKQDAADRLHVDISLRRRALPASEVPWTKLFHVQIPALRRWGR